MMMLLRQQMEMSVPSHDFGEMFFQNALDADPNNQSMRWLFAQWLAEHGDWRAAGYFFMVEQHKIPYKSYDTWEWWQNESMNPDTIRLDDELWLALPVKPPTSYPRCKEWPTRRDAEEALCQLLRREN
jgi:hypothetical protein